MNTMTHAATAPLPVPRRAQDGPWRRAWRKLARNRIAMAGLAVVVFFVVLAVFAPYMKTIGLALIHFGQMRRRMLPVLEILGKLAMADVFLIALYVVVVKGIGMARVEIAWGLYLFTACVLASIAIGHLTGRRRGRGLEPPAASGS